MNAKCETEMDKEQNPLSVESIRENLRGSIMQIALFSTAFSMEGKEREQEVGRMSADNLARFGVNSGLISESEFKDWYGAIHYNNPFLAEVALKYKGGAA